MIHHIQSLFWVAVVQLSLYDSCAQAGVLDYFSSKARSIYQQPSPNDPNDYGVDVSFPIHSFKNVSLKHHAHISHVDFTSFLSIILIHDGCVLIGAV